MKDRTALYHEAMRLTRETGTFHTVRFIDGDWELVYPTVLTHQEAKQEAIRLSQEAGRPHRVERYGHGWRVVDPKEDVWDSATRAKMAPDRDQNQARTLPGRDLSQPKVERELQAAKLFAESGDPNAMILYGKKLCQWGRYQEALKWFREAAGRGLSDAFVMIGYVYLTKDLRDEERARSWFARAVALGSEEGKRRLSEIEHLILERDGELKPINPFLDSN
ncbi:tetratricopeptide repeat protein [Pseudomonas aeruginosa]